MRVTATIEAVRVVGLLVKRADAGLAKGATRNAAASVEAARATRLETARALRDLQSLLPRTHLDDDTAAG